MLGRPGEAIGPGRKALVLVRVVRRVDLEILVVARARRACRARTARSDRPAAAFRAAAGCRYTAAITGRSSGSLRLLLDDRRERHHVVARHVRACRAARSTPASTLARIAAPSRRTAARAVVPSGNDVRVGEEIALERRRRNVEPVEQRGVAHGRLHRIDRQRRACDASSGTIWKSEKPSGIVTTCTMPLPARSSSSTVPHPVPRCNMYVPALIVAIAAAQRCVDAKQASPIARRRCAPANR